MRAAIAVFLALSLTVGYAQLPSDAEPKARRLFDSALHPSGPADLLRSADLCGALAGVHIEVARAGDTAYTVQVQTGPSLAPIHKGDLVFITFRSRSTTPNGGAWNMYLQQSSAPWTGYLSGQGNPDAVWRRFNYHWVADRDLPVGSIGLTFHVSTRAQSLDFGDFEAYDLGDYSASKLPITRITYPGREANAPWRKEAAKQIDRYRKADLTVRLVDKRGRPIAGAKVHVRMLRHAYEFGSFVEQPLLWKNADGDRYRAWFLKAYNKATTPMYWADWGWESPEEHARYMLYPQWLKAHGIVIKAHVLIYPGWGFMPTRVRKFENDPKALRAEMERHIREKLAQDHEFGIVSWDVINETRDLKDLPKTFGSEKVYADLFKLAHEIEPKPTLYINENTILTNAGLTDAQQAEYERMIRYLRSQGAPLGGIGMQAHFGEALTSPEQIWKIADRFAKFGLPLQITEFDLPIQDDLAQADYTRDLLTAWFAHPATTGFTMWGFWEGSMWQPTAALVAKDFTVRPNGKAWLDLVRRQWWTDVTLTTNRAGEVKVRGFKGDYEVTSAGKAAKLTLTTPTRITLR